MSESAVTVRPAASVLVVRQDPTGPSVLMGRRAASHRFMPGALVFPGGAVDAEDHQMAPLLWPLPGVMAQLERLAGNGLGQALACCAARELEEEAGLGLGRPPDLSGLELLCRAVTPRRFSTRFDAFFFVVDAARTTAGIDVSGELEALAFVGLAEMPGLELSVPTRFVLEQLKLWLSLAPAERALPRPVAVLREQTMALE